MQLHSPIRIGTRQSTLALKQAEILREALNLAHPGLILELVPMLTTGDRHTDRALADIGGKGLFTKELEEGLLAGRIDIAVHSLKDMETHLPHGLIIGAVLPRDDPRDALVARAGKTLFTLPKGARVSTSSPRRIAQLTIARPDLHIIPVRGNVTTRLARLKQGDADATLLALAGLKRLGLANEATELLSPAQFVPAAGQGTLAVECKQDNEALLAMLASIQHAPTHAATLAERAVLAAIGGSCRTPIGAYARITKDRLKLNAMLAKPDGSAHLVVEREGSPKDAEALGRDAGMELLARGGKDWIT